MNHIHFSRILILLAVSLAGCRYRGDCCHIDTNAATEAAVALAQVDCKTAGVSADFSAIPASWGTDGLAGEIHKGDVLNIGLGDCCCIAALHSPIANLIDKERKALCCETGCIDCIDRFLKGQAQEQRIKSAASAAELFLRLVEANLQMQLLEQGVDRIEQLEETIRTADENGLATEEAASRLDEQVIEIQKKIVDAEDAVSRLNVKLNLVLGVDSCNPRPVQPCFDLIPHPEQLDVNELVIQALSTRPSLAAMRQMDNCDSNDECLRLISQLEPRIGTGPASSMRHCLLTAISGQRNCSSGVRRQQLRELSMAREELVRQEVIDAALTIEKSFRQLALENENLARLEQRAKTIDAAEVLDAQSSQIDSISNWGEQQQARSRRITAAIDLEIARVKLREATGELLDCHGFHCH